MEKEDRQKTVFHHHATQCERGKTPTDLCVLQSTTKAGHRHTESRLPPRDAAVELEDRDLRAVMPPTFLPFSALHSHEDLRHLLASTIPSPNRWKMSPRGSPAA